MLILNQNQKEIKTVIFDFGNVLVDYSPYRFMHEIGIEEKYHGRIGDALFQNPSIWQEFDRGVLTNEAAASLAAEKDPELKHLFHAFTDALGDRFKAIPNNVEFLKKVKRAGCKVFGLSNFSRQAFEVMKKNFDFFDEFDGMIISAHHGVIKPEPEIFQLLLDTYPINPAESVFIDDLEENIQAASAFGLQTLLLPPRADIAPYFTFTEGSAAG